MTQTFHKFSEPVAHCSAIRDNIRVQDFGSGHTILIEKDHSTQVYFILDGDVKVTSFQANGKEIWHAELTAGQTFGELSAITNTPRSATVVTLKPSKIGVLSQNHFMRALKSDTSLSLHFLGVLASRLQAATLHTSNIVGRDVPGRICAELIKQASPTASEDGSYKVARELTVTALAMRLNAKRETVSRTLSTLTDAQYIKKKGRQFYILNKEALERRAED